MAQHASRVAQRQQPLREAYQERPEQAVIVKRAWSEATAETDALHGTVAPGEGYPERWRVGVDRAIGGAHDAPNPGEMLCAALAACQDISIRMIADLLGVRIVDLRVEVAGALDVRGCMLVDAGAPVGFREMACRVRLEVAPDTDPELLHLLRTHAERSCVNLDTLRRGVPVSLSFAAERAPHAT